MKHFLTSLLVWTAIISSAQLAQAQDQEFASRLNGSYDLYRENRLNDRRFKHGDIQGMIRELDGRKGISVNPAGRSIQGRSLSLISLGEGPIQVFLWSQMHGDEPTATQAIFDILNFFMGNGFPSEKQDILQACTLHFLPMLNPDGAERFTRRNALGIDINRDARRLQSPEGQTLKRVRDSLKADFGFNLHDQSTYYNAYLTSKPATLSFLAPAYNYEKQINPVREAAMQLIVAMDRVIQKWAPGQVARYDDAFEPRAFGDNIQSWGTSTILIESGGYPNDVEKQEIRKLNYIAILTALREIATGEYKRIPVAEYGGIPENDRKLFDLLVRNATYTLEGKPYILDIGIHRYEVDKDDHNQFYNSSRVSDQGDLSTFYGYETLDASGYTIVPGKVYPQTLTTLADLGNLDPIALLRQGYTYVKVAKIPKGSTDVPHPINAVAPSYTLPTEFKLSVGMNPTFMLLRDGKHRYAVVNGFLIDLETGTGHFKNGMVYR